MLFQIRDDESPLALSVEEAETAQDALVSFLADRRTGDAESVQLQADGAAVVWRGRRYTAVPMAERDEPSA
jgi:hypothetical protein